MAFERLSEETLMMLAEIYGLMDYYDLTSARQREQMYNDINALIEQLDTIAKADIPTELAYSYFEGFDSARDDLLDINKSAFIAGALTLPRQKAIESGSINVAFDEVVHTAAIESLMTDTMQDLSAAYRTFQDNAISTIEDTVRDVQNEVSEYLSEGYSKDRLKGAVMERFQREGQTAFISRDGKRLPLEYYSRMVVEAKVGQAHNRGHLSRYNESGIRLVKVVTHPFCCENCAAHRDYVYSIDGEHPDFPQLPESLLPIHNFCRCTYSPVVLEYSTQSEIDEYYERLKTGVKDIRTDYQRKQYEDRQQNLRRENSLYKSIKKALGEDAVPYTLTEFRDMKKNDKASWDDLYSKYLESRKRA